MTTDCDVLIAGGGPVGTVLALALQSSGLRVTHVDTHDTQGDRPIALSYGSRLILDPLLHFDQLTHTPIRRIHVSQRGAFGRALMEHVEYNVPALGYVVSHDALRQSLDAALARPTLPGRVIAWRHDADALCVEIESGAPIRTRLLVLADGGGARSGGTTRERDYGQAAIVSKIWSEGHVKPGMAPDTAFERFTPEGPIALLPDRDAFALVWCLPVAKARALADLNDGAFLAALQIAFGRRVGRFSRCAPRLCFELRLRRRIDVGTAGVIAIGNASQTLHPVAGQGLNLGLRDAAELAAAIIATPDQLHTREFARAYVKARQRDRDAVVRFTDTLVRGYSNTHPLLALGRGMALFAIGTLPPARSALAHAMMHGLRSVPRSRGSRAAPPAAGVKH